MNEKLLREFLRLSMNESPLARIPTQLISPEDEQSSDKKDCDCDSEDELDEFSGAGGAAGFTGPLGMNPDKLGRQKNKKK